MVYHILLLLLHHVWEWKSDIEMGTRTNLNKANNFRKHTEHKLLATSPILPMSPSLHSNLYLRLHLCFNFIFRKETVGDISQEKYDES